MQQLFLSRTPKISVNSFYNGLHGNAPPESGTNISGYRYIKKWGFHELSRCEKVGKPCWIDHKGLIKWQEDLHCSVGRYVKEHHFSLVSRCTKLTLNSLLQEEVWCHVIIGQHYFWMTTKTTTTVKATRTAKKQSVYMTKTTTLYVHHPFLYISYPLLHDCHVNLRCH